MVSKSDGASKTQWPRVLGCVCFAGVLVWSAGGVGLAGDIESKVKDHPRLLFNSEELALLRKRIEDTSDPYGMGFSPAQLWRAVLKDVQSKAKDPLPKVPVAPKAVHVWTSVAMKVCDKLTPLSIVAALVGDAAKEAQDPLREIDGKDNDRGLVAAAKENLLTVCRWPGWGDEDQPVAMITREVAVAYDILYGFLSPAEREEVRSALAKHGTERMYKTMGGDGADPAGVPSRFYGEFGMGVLALLDEHPDSRKWLKHAKAACLAQIADPPKQAWGGACPDGGWGEGFNYGGVRIEPFLLFADALLRATGDRELLDRPIPRQLASFPLYCMAPDGDMVPFGDSYPYNQWPHQMAKLASLYRDGRAQWYVQQIQRRRSVFGERRNLTGSGLLGFLWYDPSVKPELPADLPLGRHFRGIGWVPMRSGWEEDSVFLCFKKGLISGGHTHQDPNHFVLHAYGEWLVGDQFYAARRSPSLHFMADAIGHNVLLYGLGDKKKLKEDIDLESQGSHGTVTAFFTGRSFDYAAMDSKESYLRGDNLVFTRCARRMAFVKPDIIVVLDDVEFNPALDPDKVGKPYVRSLASLLHLGQMNPDGDIEVQGDLAKMLPRRAGHKLPSRAQLAVKVLFPEPAKVKLEAVRPGDGTGHEGQGTLRFGPYLQISQDREGPAAKFLSVLIPQKLEGGKAPDLPKVSRVEGKGAVGARLTRPDGTDIVLFKIPVREKEMSAEGVSSDAETVWLRLAKDGGQVSAFAAYGGCYMKVGGGRELFRSSLPIHLAVQVTGNEIRAQVAGVRDGGCALELGMGPVKSATFDGKSIAADPAGEERFRLALPGDGTLIVRLAE